MFRRSLAMWAAAAVLLAACTSHGDPAASPTPSASSTPSTPSSPAPSPTRTGPLTTGPGVRPGETPPVENALAKQHNASGALLFAGYFIKALDWSLATTDPYLLVQAALPTCKTCVRYEDRLSSLDGQGGYLRGGRISIQEFGLTSETFDLKSEFAVQVKFDQEPDTIVLPSATPSTETSKSTAFTTYVLLSWVSARWRVVEMEVQ